MAQSGTLWRHFLRLVTRQPTAHCMQQDRNGIANGIYTGFFPMHSVDEILHGTALAQFLPSTRYSWNF